MILNRFEQNNKFLLAREKLICKMHLRKPILHVVLADHLLKIKKEYKN